MIDVLKIRATDLKCQFELIKQWIVHFSGICSSSSSLAMFEGGIQNCSLFLHGRDAYRKRGQRNDNRHGQLIDAAHLNGDLTDQQHSFASRVPTRQSAGGSRASSSLNCKSVLSRRTRKNSNETRNRNGTFPAAQSPPLKSDGPSFLNYYTLRSNLSRVYFCYNLFDREREKVR